MQQELQSQYPTPPQKIARQISELSSNQSYVLLYAAQNILKGQYKSYFVNNPYLLVFQDEDKLTSNDLAAQFTKETNIKLKPEYIHLHQLNTDYHFRNMKLSQLKRIFQRETIDGFCFQLRILETNIDFQTGVAEMVDFQKIIPQKKKTLAMYIQDINYYFHVKVPIAGNFKSLKEQTAKQIKKQLNVIVKSDRISLSFTNDSFQQTKITQKNHFLLTNKDYVVIEFLDKVKITKPIYENQNSFIIIQDCHTLQQRKFKYKQVRNKKISTILDKDFQFLSRKLSSDIHGLRIHDLILKAIESFADFPILDQLFFAQSQYVKIVFAQIVKESFIFYSHLKSMGQIKGSNKQKFVKIIQNCKENDIHRKDCEKAIKDRAKNAKHLALKHNQERIEPILLYTSELLVKQKSKNPMKLFDVQNSYLRTIKFGNLQRQEYNRWQFWFTNTLLNNLKLIQQYKGVVYRGVKRSQSYFIGKIIPFKQFTSCSYDIKVAQSFAGSAGSVLYIFKSCKIARKIQDYSFFPPERQVLNLPYCEYKVVEISKKKIPHQINVVTLQQVSVPQLNFDLKDQRQQFILWVDGIYGEGLQFSKNISQVAQTTFFVHMKSTKQIQWWFKENKQKLKDPTISVSLITNMFREQDGVKIYNAGALAIKLFKSCYSKGNILVYIGDIQKAKKTLAENEIKIEGNIQITDDEYGLLSFFADKCGIS